MEQTDFTELLPNSGPVAIKDASFPPRLVNGLLSQAGTFWFAFRETLSS
jgi:hypothetical protein